jgi:uncharacterized protein
MLRVDVRELKGGPVETVGTIGSRDPLLAGLDLDLEGPLQVSGTLEATGRGDYVWHGELRGQVHTSCRRCLREFLLPVDYRTEVVFSANRDLQDDPSVYPLTEPVNYVDVGEAVREELALEVSAFPLCREDCQGLCPRCGADLNSGPCECAGRSERGK